MGGKADDRSNRALRRRLFALGDVQLNPLDRFQRFFNVLIWDDRPDHSTLKRWAYPKLRVLTLSFWNFQAHGLPTHAAALTYTSLLALIPVIAVAFSLFQVFGGLEGVQKDLMEVLVRYIAPGMESSASTQITDWVAKIRSGARANAALGTILLFVTVIRTLSTLEQTFNTIFGVKKGRAWSARITVYWAVATLGPALLGASLAMSATVKSSTFMRWLETHTPLVELGYRVVPVLLTCAAFTLLYAFLPNAHVKLRAAIVGGVVAGLAFEAAKHGFTTGAEKLVRGYDEVYGSIATLFVFLFWLYVSWTILLVGLEVVVATQSATTHRKEELATEVSESFREMIALRLVTEVSERFHGGREPPTIDKIAAALDVPDRLLRDVIDILEDAGIVRRVEIVDTEDSYVPARPLEKISVQDVVTALREAGTAGLSVKADDETRYISSVVDRANAACASVCGEETMARIVENLAEARKAPQPAPEAGDAATPAATPVIVHQAAPVADLR